MGGGPGLRAADEDEDDDGDDDAGAGADDVSAESPRPAARRGRLEQGVGLGGLRGQMNRGEGEAPPGIRSDLEIGGSRQGGSQMTAGGFEGGQRQASIGVRDRAPG